jgi:hypothetical protein
MSVLLKGNIICLLNEDLSTRKTIQLDIEFCKLYLITKNHVIVQDWESKFHAYDKNGKKEFEHSGLIPNSVYSSSDYLPLIDEKSMRLDSFDLRRPN